MLHIVIALSKESLITSYSTSFHPTNDSSINTWLTLLAFNPESAIVLSISSFSATPPPLPPRVYAGRTTTGYPI